VVRNVEKRRIERGHVTNKEGKIARVEEEEGED